MEFRVLALVGCLGVACLLEAGGFESERRHVELSFSGTKSMSSGGVEPFESKFRSA